MWDIDYTLLRGGGVASSAWKAAFTEVTGVPWQDTPIFGGRTDTDICAEVFASHGVTDCTPERFFARYVEVVHENRHEFAVQGALMPGVREVLTRLGDDPGVVQTLVTGNVPQVAAAKVAAFGLEGTFDAEVGGYGTDDSVRATLVRRSLERAEAKYGERFLPVVVGDTVYDVTAALANGAVAIAVATGATPADALAAAGAHVVLGDLSDLETTVRVLTAATPPASRSIEVPAAGA
ncbi:haloacid dehalogenase-like hydrolase [Actinoplanes utahensis]|nr:haloacid dehalogenase [Actinoplanes utahensis]